jgi:hypothetical protein
MDDGGHYLWRRGRLGRLLRNQLMADDEPLKLLALDEDDLSVISAHVQDAVLSVGDLAWRPAERRFALAMNRFDWHGAITHPRRPDFERRRAILRFDRVMGVKVQGINPKATGAVLELLAVGFSLGDAPGGSILLTFAAGGTIRLDVECIEAALTDLGGAWGTKSAPAHDLTDAPRSGADNE